MRFTPDFLDELRERVPLSSVIGTAVSWDRRKTQRAKGDFWACCPFHGENTPSFHVEDRKGRYYCFGCHASGDHFRFLTDHNGMSFPDAVAHIAELAGVPLPAADPRHAPAQRRRAGARNALETAAALYTETLWGHAGEHARHYAASRGLQRQTLETFGFGLSPAAAGGLLRKAEAAGIPAKALEEAGLALRRDDGSLYERFRGRLMVPIHDRQGRIVGFGGRDLSGRDPKYLNSPQTQLFDKSSLLFNHHRALGPAHRANRLFVVEGYLDAIALAEAGISEVVASLGTALTEAQIKLAWAMADEPVLCFDGDKAGRAAAERAMDRIVPLLSSGKSVHILTLPEGADPDDIVRSGGREAFDALAARASPLIDALVAREAARGIQTPERIAAMEQRLFALAASIPDEGLSWIYRDFFRNRAFELRREVTAFKKPDHGPARDGARTRGRGGASVIRGGVPALKAPAASDDGMADLEKIVLGLMILQPSQIETHGEALRAESFADPVNATALSALNEAYCAGFPTEPGQLLVHLPARADPWLATIWGRRDDDVGHALLARFTPLSFAPSPAFIDQALSVFVERLNLRADERELRESPAEFAAGGGHDDRALLARTAALETRRAMVSEKERALADEAVALRRAFKAQRSSPAAA